VWRVGDVSEWRSHRRSRCQWKLERLRPFHLWRNSVVRALTRNSAYARGIVVGWRGSIDLQKQDNNSKSEIENLAIMNDIETLRVGFYMSTYLNTSQVFCNFPDKVSSKFYLKIDFNI
jgi:hypothetical protein